MRKESRFQSASREKLSSDEVFLKNVCLSTLMGPGFFFCWPVKRLFSSSNRIVNWDLYKKKKMIKNMNSQMTTNSQLSTTESKNKTKNKRRKQLEQEQNHRNGDHMEGYQWRGGGERMGEKVQGIRSINGRWRLPL